MRASPSPMVSINSSGMKMRELTSGQREEARRATNADGGGFLSGDATADPGRRRPQPCLTDRPSGSGLHHRLPLRGASHLCSGGIPMSHPLRWSHDASALVFAERQRSQSTDFLVILAGMLDDWLPFHIATRLARRRIIRRVNRRTVG
jgi:hypothetical protein